MASSAGPARPLAEGFLATQEARSFLNGMPWDELAYILYEELLGRRRDEVDAEGFRATMAAIETGNLADRIAEMLDSPEFAEKVGNRERER